MGREEGSGWGTHVCLWRIHFNIWQNQYNIVKFKSKIKLKKKKKSSPQGEEKLMVLLSTNNRPLYLEMGLLTSNLWCPKQKANK